MAKKRPQGRRGGGLGRKGGAQLPKKMGGTKIDGRTTAGKQAKMQAEAEKFAAKLMDTTPAEVAEMAEAAGAGAEGVVESDTAALPTEQTATVTDDGPMMAVPDLEPGEQIAIPITQQTKDDLLGEHAGQVGLTPGQIIMPSDPIPLGWQRIFFDNGVVQAWPLPEPGFNPTLRTDTMKQVDQAYIRSLPTPDFPDRQPVQLRVNKRWRDLFRDVQSWGDSCPVTLVTDDEFPDEVSTQPAFRFVLNTEAADPAVA